MEKLKKLVDTLKFKWLKDTLGTAIVAAILVVIFIAINTLITSIDPSDIDLTNENLYSLTDESKEKIGSLPETDVFKIYMFDYDEDNGLIDFVKEYTRINKNITLEVIVSDDRPDLVSEYEVTQDYGSVVIVCGDRHLTFNSYDFYNYDSQTGAYTDITEQRITNSIIKLSSIGETTIIYELTGHEELSLSNDMTLLKTYLELENFELKQLDLLSSMNVPEDCKTLFICSPAKDLTDLEAQSIKDYINKGGNILWMSNPLSANTEIPKFDEILSMFGIKMNQDGIMLEQNPNKMIMNAPDLILPTVSGAGVSNASNVLLLDSGRLSIEASEKITELGCKRTDLLTSAPTSFFRTDLSLGINPISESAGESAESSVIACLMEKNVQEGNASSKLIAIANNMFAQDKAIPVGSSYISAIGFYDNMSFSLDCIDYLTEVGDKITIRKDINVVPYTATETQDLIIKVIIFSVPVIIIIAGVVVWNIRRRKK